MVKVGPPWVLSTLGLAGSHNLLIHSIPQDNGDLMIKRDELRLTSDVILCSVDI